jgi:hypothetical protein
MVHSPFIRELQQNTRPTGRYLNTDETRWAKFAAMTSNPDLLVVVAFCVVGVLAAFYFAFRFPDLGAMIEQYNQF